MADHQRPNGRARDTLRESQGRAHRDNFVPIAIVDAKNASDDAVADAAMTAVTAHKKANGLD